MTDAVKLLETLYDYRRAIQLLVDNNRIDAAIDVLKRYEIFNKVTRKVSVTSCLGSFLDAPLLYSHSLTDNANINTCGLY